MSVSGDGIRSRESPTIVDLICDEIARRILDEVYPPGGAMPSVRMIAAEFGVTRSTALRVLHDLALRRFVEFPDRTQRFIVRRIRIESGVEMYRYLFDPVAMPRTATFVFAEMLELLNGIVRDAVIGCLRGRLRVDNRRLRERVASITHEAVHGSADRAAVLSLVLQVLRALLSTPETAFRRAMLNSLAETVMRFPTAVDAFFTPSPNAQIIALNLLIEGPGELSESSIEYVAELCERYHRNVATHFRTAGHRPSGADDQ